MGDALPNTLPSPLSSFVGRRAELEQLGRALASTRLLTLTGAGGCGKTRLALQAAADALARHPDGIWWVELAPLADPARVPDALAGALGVRPLPGTTPAAAAAAHLSDRRALVVLDNCEHLLEPAAELVAQLLRDCPGVCVLATSREPLGLAGESCWRVPSLSPADAARLFAERAREVRPGFIPRAGRAEVVERICGELDGIPLAIELAAARVRVLEVEEIAAGLGSRFHLLTGGARAALPRQQTLRSSVEWSHELLDEAERVLLRRLAVFRNGFTLRLCEEVCTAEDLPRETVLDLLTSLVDKSLVLVEEHPGQSRFRLLETIRHFALERLAHAGEADDLRARHRDAFLALAERVAPDLLEGGQPAALAMLDAEAANLRAATAHAAASDPELALRLCSALTAWWRLHGRLVEGESELTRALAITAPEPTALRARALWGRAYLAVGMGRQELVERSAGEALEIGEHLEDPGIQARALLSLASAELFSNPRRCVRTAARSRDLARAAGDAFAEADAQQVLGAAHWCQDDYTAARLALDRSYGIARRIGNRELMAWYWLFRGMSPMGSGDLARRRAHLERGLATAAEIGEFGSEGFGTAWLALLEIWTGTPARALERLEACLERMVALGAGATLATLEGTLALALTALGRRDEARGLLEAVVARDADGLGWRLGCSLAELAALERRAGDPGAALARARHALEVAEDVGSAYLGATARRELARVAAARGQWADAEQLLHEALAAVVDGGHAILVPDLMEALAEVAGGLQSHVEAVRLLAAASRARSEHGLVRWTGENAPWARLERELCGRLGEQAHAAAAAEGTGLHPGAAVAYVRRARGERKRPPGGWESLTPTELEVVRHVADGLTNPEIAARMFIARSTVKTHLVHVYAKLGLRNRAELVGAELRHRSARPVAQARRAVGGEAGQPERS